MAEVRVDVDTSPLARKLRQLLVGVADASPLMRQWAEVAHFSVTRNFDVGGRPRWKPLSAVTIKKKGHNRPLIGRTGNLANITVQSGRTSVILGTHPSARAYAAIQQFGGRAGRNLKVLIPARPYMMLQPDDMVEMRQLTRGYVRGLARE